MTRGFRVVILAACAYSLLCAAVITIRWNHWTIGADTAVFTQIALSAFSGFRSFAEGPPHFAVHFSPILALLYPIAALTRSGLSLQYAQIILIAACAPALYALVRAYVRDGLAMRIGLLPLIYPPFASSAVDSFHEVAFFPLLVIGAVWAADRRRWWLFGTLAALSLCVREDVLVQAALIGAAVAVWAFRRKPAAQGLLADRPQEPRTLAFACAVVCIAAAATAIAYFTIIQRSFGSWFPSTYYQYSFAVGPAAVVAAIFVHPREFAAGVLTVGRLTYILEGLVPLAFMPARSPWGLLAVPGLAGVLLASHPKIWTMGSHYELLWSPWMIVAAAVFIVQLDLSRGEPIARMWANVALAGCLIFTIAFNPMHPAFLLSHRYADVADAKRALACVPAGASMSTHEDWLPHVAGENPNAGMQLTGGVDYLVYADDYVDPTFENQIRPALQAAVAAGRYRVICSYGHVRAYARAGLAPR